MIVRGFDRRIERDAVGAGDVGQPRGMDGQRQQHRGGLFAVIGDLESGSDLHWDLQGWATYHHLHWPVRNTSSRAAFTWSGFAAERDAFPASSG